MPESPWDKLPQMIEAGGGFEETTVEFLLIVAHSQKAGARVMEDIQRELEERNIAHFPQQLPRDRNRRVLLYNKTLPDLGAVLHITRELSAEQGAGEPVTDAKIQALGLILKWYAEAVRTAARVKAAASY
ncbi:hypothetical protein [Streptomyces sp. MK7]|uniref:hypothetical protein n=1 Tax=Streptomyces sp. MK7 TaxID=3067635 RepID=UPI00292EE055|nr:hypothetical protein [Streptomyces sp. MK7]